jgi:RNA-binding protein NOB1
MFCPRCGNAYLSRVSISVDSVTGQLKVHLSKLWRPRKGQKYSLPKPGHNHKHGQGRFQGELLLREDQLKMGIWQQKVKRRNKALDSMFGADITETLGMAVSKTAAADGIQFGYGKKNPNAQRGRERRGKKKKSTK